MHFNILTVFPEMFPGTLGAGDIMELDNGDMVSFRGASVDFEKKIINVK